MPEKTLFMHTQDTIKTVLENLQKTKKLSRKRHLVTNTHKYH